MDDGFVPIIFIIGAPGAGKGTLCNMLAQKYNFNHVSVGDLVCNAALSATADDELVEYIRRGELVDSRRLFALLKPEIEASNRPILLDGFPRRIDQAMQFEEAFGHPLLVLFFDCPVDVAEERVLDMFIGGSEDHSAAFKKKHDGFLALNPRVARYYENKDKLVAIDTSGETEDSWAKLLQGLQTKNEWRVLSWQA